MYSYGKAPYPGLSNSEVIDKVLAGYRMPCPANVPTEVYGIMMQCWRANPEERPAFEQLKDVVGRLIQRDKEPISNNVNELHYTEMKFNYA
jgi:hypothetical protein